MDKRKKTYTVNDYLPTLSEVHMSTQTEYKEKQ